MTIISTCLGYDKDFQPVCATLGEEATVWAKKNRGLRQVVSWNGECHSIKEWNGKVYAEIETYEGDVVYGPVDTREVKYSVEEAEGNNA